MQPLVDWVPLFHMKDLPTKTASVCQNTKLIHGVEKSVMQMWTLNLDQREFGSQDEAVYSEQHHCIHALSTCTIYLQRMCNQLAQHTSTALYICLVTGTFYGPRPALCTFVQRTPPPSLLVGWGNLLQTPYSIYNKSRGNIAWVVTDNKAPARLKYDGCSLSHSQTG